MIDREKINRGLFKGKFRDKCSFDFDTGKFCYLNKSTCVSRKNNKNGGCKNYSTTVPDYCSDIKQSTRLAMDKKIWLEIFIDDESIEIQAGGKWVGVQCADFDSVAEAEAYARALILWEVLK